MDAARIRTYKRRAGRMTLTQTTALQKHGQRIHVPQDLLRWPWEGAPLPILEIGFGMGEATLELAARAPRIPHLAIDVHTPGIGNLLAGIERHGLTNLTVIEGDADEFLRDIVPASSLEGVRLFFPDPWPKARHHKRRFVTVERLTLVAERIRAGGFLHIATDWQDYAEQARSSLTATGCWHLVARTEHADPDSRPLTRFERRGRDAGRVIHDIVAVRV